MSVDFSLGNCKDHCKLALFGICDDQPPKKSGPAYLSKAKLDGAKWTAVVVNADKKDVQFTAIDGCIEFPNRADGNQVQKCDAMLRYDNTVIFAELKERTGKSWMKDADGQLRATIGFFEATVESDECETHHAYICNSLRPRAQENYGIRMQKFEDDTNYELHIQQRIIID